MASKLKDVSKLRLVLVEGDDYAKSAGEYSLTDDKVRNKNIWVCQSNSRMMFYTGTSWVITATQSMQGVLDGSTGGFESSKPAEEPYEANWSPKFKVSEDVRKLRFVAKVGGGRNKPIPPLPFLPSSHKDTNLKVLVRCNIFIVPKARAYSQFTSVQSTYYHLCVVHSTSHGHVRT